MKNNLTELVFILDRSGSMSGLEKDTIGGYNGFIEKQKSGVGEANLSTVLFDDKYELLHDRVDLKSVKPLTGKDYFVRGSTALLDAIGKTIDTIGNKLAQVKEDDRPSKVLFVITTDGMENASIEYSSQKIKDMIEHQKDKYSWEFIFLGANIDAIETARSIGINKDRAVNFCCDGQGLELCYSEIDNAVAALRSDNLIKRNWKSKIEYDHKERSKN